MSVSDYCKKALEATCRCHAFYWRALLFFLLCSLPSQGTILSNVALSSLHLSYMGKVFENKSWQRSLNRRQDMSFFASMIEQSKCIGTIAFEKKMQVKLHDLLPYKISGRKRRATDIIISAFWYSCLLSRHVAYTDLQNGAKIAGVLEAKSKLIGKRLNAVWNFGHYRRSWISELYRSGTESYIFARNIEATSEDFQLAGHRIAVKVLHKIMG